MAPPLENGDPGARCQLLISALPRQFAAQEYRRLMNDTSLVVDESLPYAIAKAAFKVGHIGLFTKTSINAYNNRAHIAVSLELRSRQTKLVSNIISRQYQVAAWRPEVRAAPAGQESSSIMPIEARRRLVSVAPTSICATEPPSTSITSVWLLLTNIPRTTAFVCEHSIFALVMRTTAFAVTISEYTARECRLLWPCTLSYGVTLANRRLPKDRSNNISCHDINKGKTECPPAHVPAAQQNPPARLMGISLTLESTTGLLGSGSPCAAFYRSVRVPFLRQA